MPNCDEWVLSELVNDFLVKLSPDQDLYELGSASRFVVGHMCVLFCFLFLFFFVKNGFLFNMNKVTCLSESSLKGISLVENFCLCRLW